MFNTSYLGGYIELFNSVGKVIL